jgi:ABC-2 type transport system permease protein
MAVFVALIGGFRAEFTQLLRSRLFVALTIIQAVTFLFLVGLFGMTGSFAPTAIIVADRGPYAKEFVAQLETAHHSFDLRVMDQASAQAALDRGDLVAIITIPKDFSDAVAHGKETTVKVQVDNVNTDMTEDIKRALPSAIVAFGNHLHLPNIRVHATEIDLINHDTGFIPYLVVSGLALDAFVIACMLSAMAVAREFEAGTVKLLAMAPVHPLVSILGRVLATSAISALAMILPVAITVFGYQVVPLHPLEMLGVILLSIAIFSCIGVALGAVLKRTLAVASLVFGLAFPLYLCSGSLEPQRFDGNLIWGLAHISPVYYAVGILEQAFHDLQVTPEPVWLNFVALLGAGYALAGGHPFAYGGHGKNGHSTAVGGTGAAATAWHSSWELAMAETAEHSLAWQLAAPVISAAADRLWPLAQCPAKSATECAQPPTNCRSADCRRSAGQTCLGLYK